jgi:hypothetical protein
MADKIPHRHQREICITEKNAASVEAVFDDGQGHIPLWASGQTLTWKYTNDSVFTGITQQKFESDLKAALAAWEWTPVKFIGPKDASATVDFTVHIFGHMNPQKDQEGNILGHVLAMTFMPNEPEKVFNVWQPPSGAGTLQATIEHEVGHIFGLRHWFALEKEGSIVYFRHDPENPQSIMNYGRDSVLTEKDRTDLKDFYTSVWTGEIKSLKDVESGEPMHVVLYKAVNSISSSIVHHSETDIAPDVSVASPASPACPASPASPGGNLLDLAFLIGKLSGQHPKEKILQVVNHVLAKN